MADPRSVMQEFRFLEQKRQAGALTPAEAARHAQLRDLVGFEQPLPARGGFDVTAAAAQLRESLLPAGLRSRPLGSPPPPPPAPPVDPAAWAPPEPAPPTGPAPDAAPAADPLFDPASLGQEVRPQAWNPEAPGYDPDAPYDEAAWIAAGYDPNATYDWSAAGVADPSVTAEVGPSFEAGAEPALLADVSGQVSAAEEGEELSPIEFGEYDAPGGPIALGEPVEPAAPAPPPDGGASWFDDTGAAPEVLPAPETPAFGEYDAPPPAVPALEAGGEPFYGGPEGDSLPGGTPLELGDATSGWLPDGALEGGFELASDGSFGGPEGPPQVAPWSSPEPASAAERWESAPALDLSTPFEALPIPAARRAAAPPAPAPEPFDRLEPEEPAAPSRPPALEALPSEPATAPSEAVDESEPVSLSELDASIEIDVPPEIAAAYDAVPAPVLDFDLPASAASRPSRPIAAAAAAPEPVAETVAEPVDLAEPVSGGGTLVAGPHRVVVHTLDGEVLRGTLTDCDLEAPELALDTGAADGATPVPSLGVKAIFFMLAPGEQPPAPQGRRVRVTFRDGRQVAGFSPDYQEGGAGFFMIPADTRTNTGRIWVYQSAVKQVTVS